MASLELSTNTADYGSLLTTTPKQPEKAAKESWKAALQRKEFYLKLVCSSFAEFLGTTLYVFAGVSSLSNFIGNEHPHLPTVALAFGFSYAGLSAAMQHVSGGHLNPAVTVGVLIAGGINVISALFYFIAQILGGIVGASLVLAYQDSLSSSLNSTSTVDNSFKEDTSFKEDEGTNILEYASTVVLNGIAPEMAILMELMLTLMFVTVFIHTSMEKKELQSTSPALCGLTLAAGILAGYKITGGSLNPARSFGPVVVSGGANLWDNHYVYWIGPLMGGVISGVLHRLILSSKAVIHCDNDCFIRKIYNYELK